MATNMELMRDVLSTAKRPATTGVQRLANYAREVVGTCPPSMYAWVRDELMPVLDRIRIKLEEMSRKKPEREPKDRSSKVKKSKATVEGNTSTLESTLQDIVVTVEEPMSGEFIFYIASLKTLFKTLYEHY